MTEFRMHKGARTALNISAALLLLLCITIPVAAWFFYRVTRAKVTVRPDGLTAEGLLTDSVQFDDVERFGVLRIPLAARGIGAVLANMKLDNMGEGVNLVFRLKNGKDVKFIANQYERHAELIELVSKSVRAPRENLTMGVLSWKWPEKA
ncbi:MAG: hypothetical protein JNJ54_16640 [Myxococcaceae bacterium]|nr:hypothetical protein [Myxococcaceae bacterium]